jgi:hypothetical protein
MNSILPLVLSFCACGIHALDSLFLSDEAWFSLSGYVNSQNSDCGVLRARMQCTNSSAFVEVWRVVRSDGKANCGTSVS